jgi:hypothetical protein
MTYGCLVVQALAPGTRCLLCSQPNNPTLQFSSPNFNGNLLARRLSACAVLAVGATVAELVLVSVIIRNRHRIARSMLGRLYGFAYDVFSSIQGVIAMALQRSFTGATGKCSSFSAFQCFQVEIRQCSSSSRYCWQQYMTLSPAQAAVQ